MLIIQKSLHLLNSSGSSIINWHYCTVIHYCLSFAAKENRHWVPVTIHIKLTFPLFTLHIMDPLKLQRLEDSACWLLVSSRHSKHWRHSLPQILTYTFTTADYLNWWYFDGLRSFEDWLVSMKQQGGTFSGTKKNVTKNIHIIGNT